MKESKADLLLHPIRIRIIQSLVGGRRLTTQQFAERLPDVPRATLYRHLNKLMEAGLVSIAEHNQVRGTVEKVYALPEHAESITADDLLNASREDHLGFFIKFLATLMGDYSRYLEQDKLDLAADGVSYRQIPLLLTDDEYKELLVQWRALLAKAFANEPAPGRRRRSVTTIVIPEPNEPLPEQTEDAQP